MAVFDGGGGSRASRPRAAVVGLGVNGLSAALSLQRAGFDVVGFEKDRVGHDAASSAGYAKIIRFGYEDAFYANLMAETADRREHGHVIITFSGLSHEETVTMRFLERLPSSSEVVPGIWMAEDHDRHPAAGASLISREPLTDHDASEQLRSWVVVRGLSLHVLPNRVQPGRRPAPSAQGGAHRGRPSAQP
jgi:glycine/D-amino acid oxidase-like deaminating enzyme